MLSEGLACLFWGSFLALLENIRSGQLSLTQAPLVGYSLAFRLSFLGSFLALLENIRSGQLSLTQAPLVMLAAYRPGRPLFRLCRNSPSDRPLAGCPSVLMSKLIDHTAA